MIQIDRLRMMASEAILEYQSALMAGSEPSYPQWADDLLVVCDRAEAAPPTQHAIPRKTAEYQQYSFSPA